MRVAAVASMGISKHTAWLLPILVLSCGGVGEANRAASDDGALASADATDATDAPSIDDEGSSAVMDDSDGLYLVMHVGGAARLVLAPEVDDAWSDGVSVLEQRVGPTVVRQGVARTHVPAPLLAHEGELVRLEGAKGALCTARVGAPSVTARVDDSLNWERFAGEELDDDGVKLPPLSDAEVAKTAWGSSSSGHALTAELTPVSGNCADALYARAIGRGNVAVTIGTKAPSGDLRTLATRAFRALPEYAAIQERAREESVKGSWDAGSTPEVRAVDVAGSAFLYVSNHVGEGCGDFNAGLEAIYRVEPAATAGAPPTLVRIDVLEGGEQTFVGLRKREDGSLDVLYESTWVRRDGSTPPTSHTVEIPFIGCRC